MHNKFLSDFELKALNGKASAMAYHQMIVSQTRCRAKTIHDHSLQGVSLALVLAFLLLNSFVSLPGPRRSPIEHWR